ncbi:hypothetical protein BDV18DRAFT_165196 [Aspergillus unguis]
MCFWLAANSHFRADDPIGMLSPVYQGLTCQPTNDTDATCTLGGYPRFVINATNVVQIQLGINFARNTGIRLVVKNSGHDFSGKSGGAGSLSIFTHDLKDINIILYLEKRVNIIDSLGSWTHRCHL